MGVHIHVRDVPDAVFLELKARAAGSGLPLSQFLRDMMERAVEPAPVPGPAGTSVPVPR